ncbi:DUF397 domain-containing protein [Kibdelosporangium persicum]|uniref:DUF397 domain-containing protein n=1 Tax=Kibdelosporangium persicum TaxID=2698649 RepID=UPI0028AA4AF7|nr:DUF397 domain-containing protein [Kibdelosporangium persicum]
MELTWRKSSRSSAQTNASCVEIARLPHGSAVRDSKNPTAGILTFPAAHWQDFLSAARSRA